MRHPTIFLCAVLVVFGLNQAQAKIIYVPGDSSTIQGGIDGAIDGDTVLVADGNYTGDGNRDIDFSGKLIVVQSEDGPEATIIDCEGTLEEPHQGFYFHSDETSAALLDGFTIRGGLAGVLVGGVSDLLGGGIGCVSSNPTISNCIITENYAAQSTGGWSVGGGLLCIGSSLTMTNCDFVGNSTLATGVPTVSAGGGLYCHNSSPTLINCAFIGNSICDTVLQIAGGGALASWSSSPVLENCSFSGNSAPNGGGILCVESSPALENCIIAFGPEGEAVSCSGSASYPTLDCCDIYGNAGGDWLGCIADQAGINGNFSLDPLFCDTASGNLRLEESSPCAPENNSCEVLIGALGVGCGRIWYVSTTGNDTTGDGSLSNPFRTIQKGLNVAGDDDTVLVLAGTYLENIIWPHTDRIALISDIGADSTIIDGNFSANAIEISNPSPESGPAVPPVNASMVGFTVRNGLEEGIYLHGSVNVEIIQSIINDHSGSGLYCDCLGWSTGYVRMIETLLFGNGIGMTIFGGMQNWEVTADRLTISQNTQSAVDFPVGAPEFVSFIMNNSILWGNSQSISGGTPGTLNITYTDIQGGWEGEGNIDLDPVFINPQNDDFRLQCSSPCIDGGDSSYYVAHDSGGCRIDMGAYEYFFILGDANGDSVIDMADVVFVINYLFISGAPPCPYHAGDANCDGGVDLADAVYLVNYLFIGGPPPCEP